MKQITDSQIKDFKEFLEGHEFFYIIGHKEPDGDAIYSCLTMAKILDRLNKEYELLSQGPFKRPEIKNQEKNFSFQPCFLSAPERKKTGLLILDCSELHRLGDIGQELDGLDTFIIDHHKTADCGNAKSIIDPSSPATCCLIQLLYEKLIGELDEETAKLLFIGFSTDSGYFRFLDNTSSDVFEMAARMVKAGANPRKTYDFITGGKPYSTRKLLGVTLSHAEKFFNGKLIAAYETLEDTQLWGKDGRDSDALYSALLSVEGVEAVLFVRQDTENSCTAGLRSRDDVDVSKIASKFGGGGHKNASGLSCDGKIDKILPEIIKEFGEIFK